MDPVIKNIPKSILELISIESAFDYLENYAKVGQCHLGQHSLIASATQDEAQQAELLHAVGKANYHAYRSYGIARRALHETFAVMQTEFQLTDEYVLISSVGQVYTQYVRSLLESVRLHQNHTVLTMDDIEHRTNLTLLVNQRIKAGDYQVGQFVRGITKIMVIDNLCQHYLYRKYLYPKIASLVYQAVMLACQQKFQIKHHHQFIFLQKLIPDTKAKFSYIAGPPACGKGDYIERAFTGSNYLYINTDFYRHVLTLPQMGSNIESFAALTHDEAQDVRKLVQDKFIQKKKQGLNVSVLLDTVSIKLEKIELGLAHHMSVELQILITPIDKAIERSLIRGARSGRYVPLDYMKNSHQNLSGSLVSLLINKKGNDVSITLLSSDVPIRTPPKLLQFLSLKERQMTFYDVLNASDTFYHPEDFVQLHRAGYFFIFAESLLTPNRAPLFSFDYLSAISSACQFNNSSEIHPGLGNRSVYQSACLSANQNVFGSIVFSDVPFFCVNLSTKKNNILSASGIGQTISDSLAHASEKGAVALPSCIHDISFWKSNRSRPQLMSHEQVHAQSCVLFLFMPLSVLLLLLVCKKTATRKIASPGDENVFSSCTKAFNYCK